MPFPPESTRRQHEHLGSSTYCPTCVLDRFYMASQCANKSKGRAEWGMPVLVLLFQHGPLLSQRHHLCSASVGRIGRRQGRERQPHLGLCVVLPQVGDQCHRATGYSGCRDGVVLALWAGEKWTTENADEPWRVAFT